MAIFQFPYRTTFAPMAFSTLESSHLMSKHVRCTCDDLLCGESVDDTIPKNVVCASRRQAYVELGSRAHSRWHVDLIAQ